MVTEKKSLHEKAVDEYVRKLNLLEQKEGKAYNKTLEGKKYQQCKVDEDLADGKIKERSFKFDLIDFEAINIFKEKYGVYFKNTVTHALRYYLPQDVYDEATERIELELDTADSDQGGREDDIS